MLNNNHKLASRLGFKCKLLWIVYIYASSNPSHGSDVWWLFITKVWKYISYSCMIWRYRQLRVVTQYVNWRASGVCNAYLRMCYVAKYGMKWFRLRMAGMWMCCWHGTVLRIKQGMHMGHVIIVTVFAMMSKPNLILYALELFYAVYHT